MRTYQICERCVMDSSAPEIEFDADGYCNFCRDYMLQSLEFKHSKSDSSHREAQLNDLVSTIKAKGYGKAYDCIVGVSGGVDSSWVLVNAVRMGLRPLAVHMDNGWNSNLAVSNIANLIEVLDVDLFTYVINWNEYRELMEAFFRADVIDIELLYDNALHEVCYSQARKYGIQHILSGSNFSTEGIKMPKSWAWESKWDGRNIKRIAKRYGANIDTFPLFTTFKWLKYTYLDKIRWESTLDLIDYNKESALLTLERDFGYTRYPYKHYESVFTRFYQGFLLPSKFGVDKRRVHFSSLILSGQMSRSEALKDLERMPYPSPKELDIDRKFFLKKLGWEQSTLDSYLNRPAKSHRIYGTDLIRAYFFPLLILLGRLLRSLRRAFGRSTR